MSTSLTVTPPPEPTPTPLSKNDLLDALDAQIKFASEAQRNEGWTRWAIWVALAGILWHGTELVARSEFALYRAVLVSFLVFIAWTAIECLIALLTPISRIGFVAPLRFHMWTDLVSVVKPGMLASALRKALIIIALSVFHYPGQGPLWVYAVLSLATDLLIFVPGMKSFAFPSKFGVRAVFSFTTFVILSWLIFAGTCVVHLIQNDISNYTLVDVRFALLLNAAAYLLIRLATTTTTGHFLGELTDLRQHVAFDRIPITEALNQTEKLLSGIKLSEVINPSVELVIKECEELALLLKQANDLLHKAQALILIRNENPLSTPQNESMLAETLRRIDEADIEATRIDSKYKSVRRVQSRFQIRALCIALYSRECLPELRSPIQRVQEAFKQATQNVKDFHRQLVDVKMEINYSKHRASQPARLQKSMSNPPAPKLAVKGAVMLLGSLYWEGDEHEQDGKKGVNRKTWRDTSLAMATCRDLEGIPIRYGRRSDSRNGEYTIVFGGQRKGVAKIANLQTSLPMEQGVLAQQAVEVLRRQVKELAEAEGIWTAEHQSHITGWGLVAISVNQKSPFKEQLLALWSEHFGPGADFSHTHFGNGILSPNGVLEVAITDNAWQDLDYCLCTPTKPKPRERSPSPKEIADATKLASYFRRTYASGIRTPDDDEIRKHLDEPDAANR